MSGSRIYAERSCEDTDTHMVCDGTSHFQVELRDSWAEHLGYMAHGKTECDGSCRPSDLKPRILEKIEETRVQTITLAKTERVLPTRVVISDEAQAILDQNEIVCMFDDDWYCKRSGEGESFRLPDGRLLKLSISHDWWACHDTGFFLTLEVTLEAPFWGDKVDPAQHYAAGFEDKAVKIQQAVRDYRDEDWT